MINDNFSLTGHHFWTKAVKYIKLLKSKWLIWHIVGLCSSIIRECMAKNVKNINFKFSKSKKQPLKIRLATNKLPICVILSTYIIKYIKLVWFKDCTVKISVMMNENYTVNLHLFNLFYNDAKLLPSLK